MNIPYLISTLDYRTNSMGIRILHKLCKMINDLGYEAYVNAKVTMKGSRTIYGNEPKLRQLIIDGAIAVYPEINKDNYLWSKNPVGWILNDGEFNFEREGLVFTYSKRYRDCETLTIIEMEKFFTDDKKYERKYNTLYIGKGTADTRMNEIKDRYVITLTDPKTREKLADLLKRSKVFYTYDSRTALSSEAKLCGCPVVILENGINKLTDFNAFEGDPLGVTNNINLLDKAKCELALYPAVYQGISDKTEAEVVKFIKITQEWARERLNGKTCENSVVNN